MVAAAATKLCASENKYFAAQLRLGGCVCIACARFNEGIFDMPIVLNFDFSLDCVLQRNSQPQHEQSGVFSL